MKKCSGYDAFCLFAGGTAWLSADFRSAEWQSRAGGVGRGRPEKNLLQPLVIEDDPDLNRQLTTALADAGYVDRAFDGEEGHFLGDSEPGDAVTSTSACRRWTVSRVLESCWRPSASTFWTDARPAGATKSRVSLRAPMTMLPSPSSRRGTRVRVCCGAPPATPKRIQLRPRASRYPHRPRGGRWQPGQAHLARIPSAVLSHAPCRLQVSAPNWSSICTTRTSTVTPIPLRLRRPHSKEVGGRCHSDRARPWLSPPAAERCALTRMRANSLALRPFVTATLWTVVILVGTAISALAALPAGSRTLLRRPSVFALAGSRRRPGAGQDREFPQPPVSPCSSCSFPAGIGR